MEQSRDCRGPAAGGTGLGSPSDFRRLPQLDPASVLAVALGLSWKKQCGGELVGIAAGPESWEPALRDALALGIHRASRVHQDKCDLPDIAATAAALVTALPADAAMVIAGPERRTTAARCRPRSRASCLPLLPFTGLEARVDGVSVEVRAGTGRRATYLLKEPAVLAAARAALPPSYPPLARRFAAGESNHTGPGGCRDGLC